jgi:8-oxo-dGTP diphosphatase
VALRRFPVGAYGRQRLEFFPCPQRAPLRAFAALVFAWHGDKALLCDIEDRGWCIPSGRVELNETSCEAARREAIEEAGAVLAGIHYLGCYRVTDRNDVRWADVFAARVSELVPMRTDLESRGRRLVRLEDLPDLYHLWNPLTAELFRYSREVLDRRDRLASGEVEP